MAIVYETHTVASEGISLDAALWRRFKRPMPGLEEQLLDLSANQHLEACPFILPLGTVVVIPIEPRSNTETVKVISLWD